MKKQAAKFSVLTFADGSPVPADNDKASLPAVAADVAKKKADKAAKDAAKGGGKKA